MPHPLNIKVWRFRAAAVNYLKSIVIRDDSTVIEAHVYKRFSDGSQAPGVYVQVEEVSKRLEMTHEGGL